MECRSSDLLTKLIFIVLIELGIIVYLCSYRPSVHSSEVFSITLKDISNQKRSRKARQLKHERKSTKVVSDYRMEQVQNISNSSFDTVNKITGNQSDSIQELNFGKFKDKFRYQKKYQVLSIVIDQMMNTLRHFVDVGYTNNIMITVKTSYHFYSTRLPLLLLTWMQTVDREKLFIVSDRFKLVADTVDVIRKAGFNLITSRCKPTHSMSGLCCKTSEEFSTFYREVERHKNDKNRFKWFCHFDDDVYVNIKALSNVLDQFDPDQPYYIGKQPEKRPVNVFHPIRCESFDLWNVTCTRYWYLHSTGAGYCLSYAMMMKVSKFFNDTTLFCDMTLLGDDIAIGAVIGSVLGYNLTTVDSFHNQYEDYSNLTKKELIDSVMFSYKRRSANLKDTRLNLDSQFPQDWWRFKAYHCLLYPRIPWCAQPEVWNAFPF